MKFQYNLLPSLYVKGLGVSLFFLLLLLLFSCTQRERSKDVSSSVLRSSLRTTPVKDQGKVEACWIYAYLACIETERIENYRDSMNLSPIWLVRNLFQEQASESYLSQGTMPVSVRGIGPDAERLLKEYGMVQWSTYCPDNLNSRALARLVRQKVKFVLEVPDNHHRHALMNVPINDMYSQVVEALQNHHPVYWEGQMPRNKKPSIDGDLASLRQRALERFITTDQHAMAIVGLTKTKQGDTRFICKNSWGENGVTTATVLCLRKIS